MRLYILLSLPRLFTFCPLYSLLYSFFLPFLAEPGSFGNLVCSIVQCAFRAGSLIGAASSIRLQDSVDLACFLLLLFLYYYYYYHCFCCYCYYYYCTILLYYTGCTGKKLEIHALITVHGGQSSASVGFGHLHGHPTPTSAPAPWRDSEP